MIRNLLAVTLASAALASPSLAVYVAAGEIDCNNGPQGVQCIGWDMDNSQPHAFGVSEKDSNGYIKIKAKRIQMDDTVTEYTTFIDCSDLTYFANKEWKTINHRSVVGDYYTAACTMGLVS